jgi:hypothetical protein
VHVREQDNRWQILVPRNRRDRELCYLRQLPEALTKLFHVTSSAREIIGNVLNSSPFVIDDLLEAAGIGKVSDIQSPPRPSLEELDEQEIIATEEATAPSRNSRAQSAPLLTSRNRLGQPRSSDRLSLENGELSSSFIDTEIPLPSTIFPGDIPASISSTTTSDIQDTPASSGLRDPTLEPLPELANISPRSLSPEDVGRGNFSSNDAYRELLDNVIRIANRTNLPHRDFMTEPRDFQFHQGFDHEAAFGIRSQDQMTHDTRIGAAGELFVSNLVPQIVLKSDIICYRSLRCFWICCCHHLADIIGKVLYAKR